MNERSTTTSGTAYDRITIFLHWVAAASAAVLWTIGRTADRMPDEPANTAVRSAHAVLGFVLAATLAWRVVWRASGGRRLPPADGGVLQTFAKLTHSTLTPCC